MQKVRAIRNVCIGVGKVLKDGDVADLDDATVRFLVSIKSVEVVPKASDEPPATLVSVSTEDEQVIRDEAAATVRADDQPKGKKEK